MAEGKWRKVKQLQQDRAMQTLQQKPINIRQLNENDYTFLR